MIWAGLFGTLAFFGLLSLALWGLARRAASDRRKAGAALMSSLTRLANMEAQSATRLAAQAVRACRAAAIAGVTAGAKCVGCSRTVKRDDLAPAGEDARGRPVELCGECRKLVGM